MALLHLLMSLWCRKWRGVSIGTNGIAAFIGVTVEAGSEEVCLWALIALLHLLMSLWCRKWRGVSIGTNGIAAFIGVTVVAGSGEVCL